MDNAIVVPHDTTPVKEPYEYGGGSHGPTDDEREWISSYTEQEQALMLAFWPHVWNRPSKYFDNHIIARLPALLNHIEAFYKSPDYARAVRLQTKAERGQEKQTHKAWENDCRARKEWIESKRKEWLKRCAERKAAQAVFDAQWAAYVDGAKTEWDDARATPAPPRP